jgi:transcriptional regulator with XRE-family HTH domain
MEASHEWRSWMRELGQRFRKTREILGLSQSQLAELAGVSQGAISRLETGRGLATPLLVVLRTSLALRRSAEKLGPEVAPDEFRELSESLARHVGESGTYRSGDDDTDTGLVELIGFYRSLPPAKRERLVEVVRATSSALASDAVEAAPS